MTPSLLSPSKKGKSVPVEPCPSPIKGEEDYDIYSRAVGGVYLPLSRGAINPHPNPLTIVVQVLKQFVAYIYPYPVGRAHHSDSPSKIHFVVKNPATDFCSRIFLNYLKLILAKISF